MYNISELQAMPDDTLKSVAEGMGLKKVNPAKREELIYRILDEQAIVLSANASEEAPRRRGRRPKNQSSPDTSKANPDKIQNTQSQLGDEPDATQDRNDVGANQKTKILNLSARLQMHRNKLPANLTTQKLTRIPTSPWHRMLLRKSADANQKTALSRKQHLQNRHQRTCCQHIKLLQTNHLTALKILRP